MLGHGRKHHTFRSPTHPRTLYSATLEQTMQYLQQDRFRQFLTLVAILAAFGTNVASNLVPVGGETIGKIANTKFKDVLIIPANYAFAIWGLIYVGLIGFGIYQARPAWAQNLYLRRAGYFVVLAMVAQIAWVYIFLYRYFAWSLLAMVVILLATIAAYLRMGIGIRRAIRQERWWLQAPISLYMGWISVATVVNVAIALHDAGWHAEGMTATIWTIVMAVASTAISAILRWRRHDNVYPAVTVWALVAIAIGNLNTSAIAFSAGGLAIALILWIFFCHNRRNLEF